MARLVALHVAGGFKLYDPWGLFQAGPFYDSMIHITEKKYGMVG